MKNAGFIVKIILVAVLLGALIGGVLFVELNKEETDGETVITVMSYNVRCFTLGDVGNKSWGVRKKYVAKVIENADPDVIGFQEVMDVHEEFFKEKLKGYSFNVAYREEHLFREGVAIAYKTDKFTLEEEGMFWLSETPEKMSKDWGSNSFRVADYVVLTEKKSGKNTTLKTPHAEEPFHLGMAGWTFNKFDIQKTLETMKQLDVHYLCIKDFHLPLKSTDEEIAAFHKKLAEYGVIGYGVGPIYMKSEAEVDRAFAYAKRVGVKVLVGVPNYELLDYVERTVKQYDIKLAIHLHGPDMPMYPNAEDIWNNVKDRDARMGMCLDIGHNLRYGSDSLSDLKKYHSRVFDIHMKDVTGTTKADKSVELGRGRIDFPLFVRLLRKYNYTGSISLEYEKDMSNPFMGIAESVGYFRGVCYATK